MTELKKWKMIALVAIAIAAFFLFINFGAYLLHMEQKAEIENLKADRIESILEKGEL